MQEAAFFQLSAASMIATWIWAASFYASATSGFRYGLSGPIHYGSWGALMIIFIYPYGRRFGAVAVFFEFAASVGGGVVIGLMTFAFFNRNVAIALVAAVGVILLPLTHGFLRDYMVLLSSLTAYGVSATVCVAMSWRSKERFDFDLLAERVTSFHLRFSLAGGICRGIAGAYCCTGKRHAGRPKERRQHDLTQKYAMTMAGNVLNLSFASLRQCR